MRILILTQTFPLTPADHTAHFMFDFALGFTQLGHDVYVVLPFHPRLRPDSFPQLKLLPFKYSFPDKFHLLGFGNSLENDQRLKWFNYFLGPLYLLFGTIALYKAIKTYHITLVNAHWILPNGFLAALISLASPVPLYITLPGSDVFLAKKNLLFRLMAQFAISRARKIISNSPQLLADLGVVGEVLSYPVRQNLGRRIINQVPIMASAGRRVAKKGFAPLQELFSDLVIISGLPINAFRRKLLSVDIFIANSVRDESGNLDDASLTVLEAMAAGCAVIASDFPGYRRIISPDRDGILVPPGNLKTLQLAVGRLRQDAGLRRRLGDNARLTIKKRLTPKTIAQKYLEIFSQ